MSEADEAEQSTVERRPPTHEPAPRDGGSEARRAARRMTDWKAVCRLRNGILTGQILDITSHGAFFAPDDINDVTATLSVMMKVALRLDESSLSDLELPARVRWIGYSSTHGRIGFGVEFSHMPMPLR